MGWQHHQSLVEGPRCVAVCAPQPHLGPSYSPQRGPIYPWEFFAAWPTFEEALPPPPLLGTFLFFIKSGLGSRPTKVVRKGREGGRLARTWEMETSLEDEPLFLPTRRSFRPLLWFRSIFSSPSKLGST